MIGSSDTPSGGRMPLEVTPEIWRRAAVTIGALLVYRLGCMIPLAGLDSAALEAFNRSSGAAATGGQLSPFSLGVIPLLSALALAEFVMIVFPPVRRLQQTPARPSESFHRWIFGAALFLAASQGYRVARTLEEIDGLVTEPGSGFQLLAVASFAGATACLAWLAHLITRHGLGSGLWMLAAMPLLLILPGMSEAIADAVQSGAVAPQNGVIACALLVSAAALFTGFAKRTRTVFEREHMLWGPILAYTMLSWLMLPALIPGQPDVVMMMSSWLSAGNPFRIISLPVLTFAFALWRSQAGIDTADEAVGANRTIANALILALGVLAIELAIGCFNVPFPMIFDGQMAAILVAVAVALLDDVRSRQPQT